MTLSHMEAPGGFWAGQWGDLTSISRLTQALLSLDWKGEQGGSRETNQEAVTIIQVRNEAGLGQWWWLTWARFWVGLEGRANRICWRLQVGSEKKRRVRDDTSNSGLTTIEWGWSLTGREDPEEAAALQLSLANIFVTRMLFAALCLHGSHISQTHLFLSLQVILPWRLWDLILGDLFSTPNLEALPGHCPGLRPPSPCTAGRTGLQSMHLGDDCHEALCRGQQDTLPQPAGVLPARDFQMVEKQTLYSYSSELRHFNIHF